MSLPTTKANSSYISIFLFRKFAWLGRACIKKGKEKMTKKQI
jgi:hypothetical protein